MSYQVLARKWRPRNFEEVVGQEAVIQALVNGLDNDRVHHAFLLTGTRGVGKTTLARVLAKSLNCEAGMSSTPCGECGACADIDEGRFVDMLEIDAASKTGVDDIRDLIENAQYAPSRGRFKVYIIDEVHMLSRNAFNGLLKTLEEPPPHVKFVLATTDADKIPITILSRCLRFNLRRLMPDQIGAYLEKILRSESFEFEAGAVERIARAADGSMRDGLSLLDQAIAYGGGALVDSEVADMLGSVDHAHLVALIEFVVADDAPELLKLVEELSAQARDLESVLTGLAEVLHRICLVHCAPDYRDETRSDWDSIVSLAEKVTPQDAQLFYQIAIQGGRDLGLAPDPRTGLEMAMLRMLAFRPVDGSDSAPSTHSSGASAKSSQPSVGAQRTASSSAAPSHSPAVAERTASASTAPSQSSTAVGQRADSTAADAREAPPEHAAGNESVLEGGWLSIQERLGLTGPARELARNVELVEQAQGRWRFLVPETAAHYGSKGLVEQLEGALSQLAGTTIEVVLNVSKQQVNTVAAAEETTQRGRMSEAEKAITQDETVQSLKERLGASVVENSIQPLQ